MHRFHAFAIVAALSLLSIGCSPESHGQAEEPKAEANGERKVAVEATKVLTDWYAALKAAKSLQCDINAAVSVKQNGTEVQADSETVSFAAERPNKLAIRAKKPGLPTLVCDGDKLFRFDAQKNVYTLGPALPDFAAFEKSLILSTYNQNQGLSIVGDALAGMSLEKLTERYSSIEYVAKEVVGETSQHHLRVAQDGVHYDWWFSAEAAPQLLTVSPKVAEIAAKNGRRLPPEIEVTLKVSFTDVKYDAALSADAFKIAPPSDATLVDDLDAPLGMTLVGKPAPMFEGKNIKGETVKLADLAGKIVVVDFWATWCPPCVAGLPKLAEMTAKHKDDGVVFLAVNLQEEPSIVKEFLELKKLDINVVMDTDNSIMKKYKVEPVPQTVFIDRKGVVQIVHIGIGELEEIPNQLKDLVAGKDLAAAKKK